jgi:hypothetical protein
VEKVVFSLRGLPIVFQRSKMAKVELRAQINQSVSLSGTHTFGVANNGSSPATIFVEVTLVDSRGHNFSATDTYEVPAQGRIDEVDNSYLTASYDSTGQIRVTATTAITGATSHHTTSSPCTFSVS